MRFIWKINFAVFCSLLIFQSLCAQASGSKINTFDLFGFQAGTMLKGRLVSAQKAQEELLKRKIQLKADAGRAVFILSVDGKKFLLELGNSETEGFWFKISDLEKEIDSVREGAKEINVSKEAFRPLSVLYPSIQLGETTSEELVSFLGKANYSGPDENDETKSGLKQYIWFLKRDYQKEKSCFESVSKKPPFEAIEIVFTFDKNNKLRKINFVNGISGEC